jgi:integral membrane protein (TIGR01906 family)
MKRIITFLLPIFLLLTSVMSILLTAKKWIQIEYRLPGFPQDPFGFTLEDRLFWAAIDIDYLLNRSGPEYFDTYRLDDGRPMHNERELRHMEDVKQLIQAVRYVWVGGLISLVSLSAVLVHVGSYMTVLEGFYGGSRATLIIMVVLILGVIAAFGLIFVGFHRLFFEGNTWIFSYSDTFIRLYPERFWQDTFIYVAFFTIVEALVILFLTRRLIGNHAG